MSLIYTLILMIWTFYCIFICELANYSELLMKNEKYNRFTKILRTDFRGPRLS